ncbi:DASS family sodium-coupled anion symporter [Sulfurimonas marina]|uniref:DASS family sodium-coupled anion symporter n=1 Tax=Sulfurimonas marina TaxID=2590551 RepID=A0A7M1AVV4_9BACT|nr:DASS family sodium-coupled anion symporter [Sulfurimonas marina]QOP41569.1 DASS family sodium-coupled anion symporter [Sulfurimonas marina]
MGHHKTKNKILHLKQLAIFIVGILLWFTPTPDGLTLQAWHLFAIFISVIFAVIIEAFPIFTASIIGVSFSILTSTLSAKEAYSGFSQSFILLIIVAFLIARGVIKSGLGKRIAFLIIKKFGKSSLGLGYSMIAADMFIAPAFPSNTARSGVLFPIVNALAADSGSKVADGTRKKLGAYLMMTSMAGITISSAMWLTAMAANPAGVKMAEEFGINISYGSWALAASLPTLLAFIAIPWVLFKIFPPEIKETPDAPQIAERELEHMGPVHKNEYIMGFTFIAMVTLWVLSPAFGFDKTAIAFLGLAAIMITNIFTLEDLAQEGRALGTLVWFAILYSMSSELNHLGFMSWLGAHISEFVVGYSWQMIYIILVLSYVAIHYFFVSQTAQMLALFSVFLGVGVETGVPAELLALMLLFATNFNAMITPQGSSANVIYLGSGYIESKEVYKYGGVITLLNSFIYLTVGSFWIISVI